MLSAIPILWVPSEIPWEALVVNNILWLKLHVGVIGRVGILSGIILRWETIRDLMLRILWDLVPTWLYVSVLCLWDLSLLVSWSILVLLNFLVARSLIWVWEEILLSAWKNCRILTASSITSVNIVVVIVATITIRMVLVVAIVIIVSYRVRRWHISVRKLPSINYY